MAIPADIIATITSLRDTTHDTRVFLLHPHADNYAFLPGQHCLVDAGLQRPRPFSFTTSPLQGPGFELAIKREGVLTDRMFALKAGDLVHVSRPLSSRLSLQPNDGELAMVAGGTGVTPFMSIIRDAALRHLSTTLWLLCAHRTAADIIFRTELEELSRAHPALTVVFTLTRERPADWPGEHGRIDAAMLHRQFPDWLRPRWLLCGPPLMVVALRRELLAAGVPAGRVAV
ncbi:MAG: FAD-binding oxidoreductase [bacterium]|nr:FAD-binding oxidoreductase [bacterium]